MARAPWASEYIPGEIVRQILIQIGYSVSAPADRELNPDVAYRAIADSSVHFWANSWYPSHLAWHEQELDDGSRAGDNLEILGGAFGVQELTDSS